MKRIIGWVICLSAVIGAYLLVSGCIGRDFEQKQRQMDDAVKAMQRGSDVHQRNRGI